MSACQSRSKFTLRRWASGLFAPPTRLGDERTESSATTRMGRFAAFSRPTGEAEPIAIAVGRVKFRKGAGHAGGYRVALVEKTAAIVDARLAGVFGL